MTVDNILAPRWQTIQFYPLTSNGWVLHNDPLGKSWYLVAGTMLQHLLSYDNTIEMTRVVVGYWTKNGKEVKPISDLKGSRLSYNESEMVRWLKEDK